MPTLRLLNTESSGHDGEVLACTYTADSAFVLSSGWDGYLRFWDARQGTQVSAIQASQKAVSACAVTPDGQEWISASMEGVLAYWDAKSLQQQSSFHASRRPISAVVFANDGHSMATAGREREQNHAPGPDDAGPTLEKEP